MQIVKYDGTKKEQDRIIAEKTATGLILTDVADYTENPEGHFLGFKEPDEIKTPTQTSIETRLEAIESKMDSLLQSKTQ